MAIYGEGNIKYKSTEINSANIIVDFEKYEIDAVGVPKDSASAELTGTPVLIEGSETYEGRKITYNFKTGQGSFSMADTEALCLLRPGWESCQKWFGLRTCHRSRLHRHDHGR